MTDQDLIHQLRNSKGWPTLGNAAADRIEALIADRDRFAQEVRAVALQEAAEVAANEADYVPVKPEDFRKAILALIDTSHAEALERVRREEREAIATSFEERNMPFYPIEMPINARGEGPATVGVDAVRIVYEVWDAETLTGVSEHEFLADAIAAAIRAELKGQDDE